MTRSEYEHHAKVLFHLISNAYTGAVYQSIMPYTYLLSFLLLPLDTLVKHPFRCYRKLDVGVAPCLSLKTHLYF